MHVSVYTGMKNVVPCLFGFQSTNPPGYLEPCGYQGWLKPTNIQHTHSHTCTEIRQIIMVNSSVDSHDSHDYNTCSDALMLEFSRYSNNR